MNRAARTASQSPPSRPTFYYLKACPTGEVAERLNAPVSKTGMGYQSIGGSNPPLSAVSIPRSLAFGDVRCGELGGWRPHADEQSHL